MKQLQTAFFYFISLFFATALLCLPANVSAQDMNLGDGWEYAWGDSAFNSDGVPLWTQQNSLADWQPIAFPADPPARSAHDNVWFRIKLPQHVYRDPVFYASSIDLLAEVYLDGELIYKHGQLDQNGVGVFAGWPWHMITLPENFAGKTLYFRVYSNYINIGFWGERKLTERVDALKQIIEESLQGFIVAGVTIFIALMAAIFAMLKGQRRQFLNVCLFSLAAAGLVLGDIPAMKLIWDQPLLWNYIGAYAYFLLPIPMFMLLAEWLSDAGLEVRHFQWLWRAHFVFLLLAAIGSVSGLLHLTQLYPAFDGMFIVTLLLLVVFVLLVFNRVRLEQKLLILAYFGFCSVMMLDMAVAHNWISWSSVPVSSGALLFSVAIIGLSFNHYLSTQRRLAKLNISLESKVIERTEQLSIMVKQEALRANGLLFQQEKLEIVSDIIFELESCHTLEVGIEKIANNIEALCAPFSGVFSIAVTDEWRNVHSWGDVIDAPFFDITALIKPKFNNEKGFFPFRIVNQQGSVRYVAMLQVLVTEELNGYTTLHFMKLLKRAIEKINITLANIALREELQRFSYEDELTGLKNRRFFSEVMECEIVSAEKNQEALSLLICDIDYFKKFNDTYGHPAGDEALKTLASLLSHFFHEGDIVCRLGGEEFVVVMPRVTSENCLRKAEQLIAAVEKTQIEYEGNLLENITISIGISSWPELTSDPRQLFQQTDSALYQAKESGRNCIRVTAK
ncbi:GGDEF domain-containing protein [Marinomonas sp. BSi20584]|uniref:GGDEF domain-containing protein n=1 Tax=Marinomonas sp. BSi20584 TaxID=1594462 RepID=UPI0012FDC055|nr:GGDEF domain-containing protein [Marinomonas sp. BSi20584]